MHRRRHSERVYVLFQADSLFVAPNDQSALSGTLTNLRQSRSQPAHSIDLHHSLLLPIQNCRIVDGLFFLPLLLLLFARS